tara:strand:- start:415319 stop:416968 length:1650 start_codon:yes stop_codon:yes gene_type:complete
MLPDWQALQYFHFLRPGWALILIPWALIIIAQLRRQDEGDMFGSIIAPHLLEHLRLKRFESRWFNPRTLTHAIMLLSLIILMGPSWRQQPSPLSQDEAALVILLDASASMSQSDIQPSRGQRARQKISDLLSLRPDKKTALIAYAGTAHTVLTLTADQDILNQYLAAITPNTMPRAGKFPEYALPLVDEVLRETSAPATIVLFTDGLGADSTNAFADYFDQHPHQLIVVGVGTEDVREGQAPLERDALEQLAKVAGGDYLSLTTDDRDMRRVNRRVDSHYVVVENSALPWLDSGYPLVFPALVLFLMWFRKGWTLTWLWLLVPLLLVQPGPAAIAQEASPVTSKASDHGVLRWFASLWMTPDQQGRALLQWGRYQAAAEQFQNPSWKGIAYYYNEDFMLAAEYFSRSDSDDALFNEANARAQARDYLRAVNRYDRLLERNPQYPGAANNRDTVQAIIDEINRISESQQQEAGVSSEERELGGDDAVPAEGAEEVSWEQAEIVQLTAQDILQDEATRDMWLRGVQQDPSDFLAIKFGMQLQRRESEEAQQ